MISLGDRLSECGDLYARSHAACSCESTCFKAHFGVSGFLNQKRLQAPANISCVTQHPKKKYHEAARAAFRSELQRVAQNLTRGISEIHRVSEGCEISTRRLGGTTRSVEQDAQRSRVSQLLAISTGHNESSCDQFGCGHVDIASHCNARMRLGSQLYNMCHWRNAKYSMDMVTGCQNSVAGIAKVISIVQLKVCHNWCVSGTTPGMSPGMSRLMPPLCEE